MRSLKISAFIYLLGVFLLQFYVFRSGVLQPSHIFILFSFFIILFKNGFPKNILKNKTYFNLVIFVVITLLINSFFSILYKNTDFIISSSYYIYGLIFTLVTITVLNINIKFKKNLSIILFFSLFTLVALWLIGLGAYEFSPRYNGFFNDPNQMAHWSLCVAVSIILLTKSTTLKYFTILLTFIIIIISMSRSGLVGLSFLILGLFIPNKKNLPFILIGFIMVTSLFSLTSFKKSLFLENYENVINRFLETDFEEQADTRGYSRAKKYPEYLILGSGQGLDSRFHSDFEIHSSWMGILFYYGIFSLIFFVTTLLNLIFSQKIDNLLITLGPLIYGFSTFGIRTPVFWLLLGVLIYITNFKKFE
jgi:hypothetical protein